MGGGACLDNVAQLEGGKGKKWLKYGQHHKCMVTLHGLLHQMPLPGHRR